MIRPRDSRFEWVEPQDLRTYQDPEEFDRIAFAMRALELLSPKRLTVAVYPAISTLRVERGRALRPSGDAWAIVGIPPRASRAEIAYALAELAGRESVPYAVEVLLRARSADA